MAENLRLCQEYAHRIAMDAGWYSNPETGEPIERNFGEAVALIHSELSEALEADRKGVLADQKLPHRGGVEVELTDVIIRLFDIAEYRGYDIGGTFVEKCRINKNRNDHKRDQRMAPGGKRY